jgi:hypothetical protein
MRMAPDQVAMLFGGILLFVVALGLLIYFVATQRPFKSVFFLFLVAIIMIGFPSIKSFKLPGTVVELNRSVAIPAEVPRNLPSAERTALPSAELTAFREEKARLEKWREGLDSTVGAHNSKCSRVTVGTSLDEECREEEGKLKAELSQYNAAVQAFRDLMWR